MGGCYRGCSNCLCISFSIHIIGQNIPAYRKVHEGIVNVVDGFRGIAFQANQNVYCSTTGCYWRSIVENTVNKFVWTNVIGIGRVSKSSIRIDGNRTIGWATNRTCSINRLIIPFWIEIVVQYIAIHYFIHIGKIGIVISHRNISVIGNYRNGNRGSITKRWSSIITDGVLERIDPYIACWRDISISTRVGIDIHSNSLRGNYGSGSYHNRITIRIVIVHQNVPRDRCVNLGSIGIGIGHWGFILRIAQFGHFNVYGSCIGSLWVSIIHNGVLEGIFAHIICGRGIGIGSRRTDCNNDSLGRCYRSCSYGLGVSLKIDIIGENISTYRDIHKGVIDIVNGVGSISNTTHRNVDSCLIPSGCAFGEIIVNDFIHKLVVSNKTGIGRIRKGSVGIDGQGSIAGSTYWSHPSVNRLIVSFWIKIVIQHVS